VSYLVFIVVLCAMVVIHEFGHFIVAKLLGIPAEVFSVGFGPRLFGFKLGETDFRFSAIPLGGYVRFKGENLEGRVKAMWMSSSRIRAGSAC
jgi:regulator of sigma E protease